MGVGIDGIRKYLKPLITILVLNVVIFVFVAILHELGHAVFGLVSGCENIRVVIFDMGVLSAYTAMECPEGFLQSSYNQIMIFLSSYFFILPVSALLFVLKNQRVRFLGVILLGANIMASSYDLLLFYESRIVNFLLVLTGLLMIVHGQVKMVMNIFSESTFITQDEEDMLIESTRSFIRGENQTNEQDRGGENDDDSS